jgi:probable H4MPT-linked C1 transfer pathway protein
MSKSVLGLDVGGANLKSAHSDGTARSVPFALWKDPAGLTDALRTLIASMPPADQLALAMTGELCDCFESKRQGVLAILDAVEKVAENRPIHVWRNDGQFVDPATARSTLLQVASANWLALAAFAGQLAPKGPALLIDVGSTTTDIVPLVNGRPVPKGRTDPERLRCSELVYLGVRRTPLCAIRHDLAAELFATTQDLFLILNWLPEAPENRNTPDGRPATRAAAHARLARMLCADLETSTEKERQGMANVLLLSVVYRLTAAVEAVAKRLPGTPETVILSGEGEFLTRVVLEEQKAFPPCRAVHFTQELGAERSKAACAYAVAVLAKETMT